jgi:uncharacterized protein (TIGR00725 family)
MARPAVIAVIGAGDASMEVLELALETGREIAAQGATLVCGGLGGVMEAAARGARERGGHTIGILPSYDTQTANPFIEFAVATGMREARNAIVVGSADAVIAMAGEGGTLAEIGFALKLGRPLVALKSWPQLAGLYRAETAATAVALALELAGRPPGRS